MPDSGSTDRPAMHIVPIGLVAQSVRKSDRGGTGTRFASRVHSDGIYVSTAVVTKTQARI